MQGHSGRQRISCPVRQQSLEDESEWEKFYPADPRTCLGSLSEIIRKAMGGQGPLKTLQEVKRALDAGASTITRPSEKMDAEVLRQPKEWVDRKFREEIDEGDVKSSFTFLG
jgi:Trp operon repressor